MGLSVACLGLFGLVWACLGLTWLVWSENPKIPISVLFIHSYIHTDRHEQFIELLRN